MMIKSTLTAGLVAMLLAGPAFADDDDDRRRGDGRDDRYDHRDDRDDDRHDGRRHDRRDDRGRYDYRRDDHGRYDHRRHDRDWGDDDWRDDRYWRDDRNWRGDRNWRRDRHWRHIPPSRYSLSFGYRSGYELAWSDWNRHGRHDRGWHRRSLRGDHGFRAGYEAGWRDAARYYGRGYRPRHWERDPRGTWFFGFRIDG